MDKQHIIATRIAQLNGESGKVLDQASQAQLANDPELQQELAFIEAFWQPQALKMEQPSVRMDQAFYSMLSKAQASQTVQPQTSANTGKLSAFMAAISRLVFPHHSATATGWRFASLALVFLLGYNLNHTTEQAAPSAQLSHLNQQVSSLSTLMAVSLLQQTSASERLSGVAYSQQANLSDPQLSALLISSLKNDPSVPVRLAIINSLSQSNIGALESQLITLAIQETHVLVQIELCRLLLNQASVPSRKQLLEQLSGAELHPDLQRFIAQFNQQIQA